MKNNYHMIRTMLVTLISLIRIIRAIKDFSDLLVMRGISAFLCTEREREGRKTNKEKLVDK